MQLLQLPLKSEIFYNLMKPEEKENLKEKEKLENIDDTNNSEISKNNNEENFEGK